MHKRRAIRPNHDTRQPTQCVFFDCETYQDEVLQSHCHHQHVYRLSVTQHWVRKASTWTERNTNTWKNPHEMWSYIIGLTNGRSDLVVMAHNAMFDLTVSHFWDYLDGGEIILHGDRAFHKNECDTVCDERSKWQGLFVADEKRVIIECCTRKGMLKILDSMNYYRCSLAKLGEAIHIPKHQMPAFSDHDSDWMYYCINDVKVLAQSMIGLMREWHARDYGNWQPTASSLSWSCYRHKYMPRKIEVHNDTVATDLERRANFGGECRAFFIGDIDDEYTTAVKDWTGKCADNRHSIAGPCHLYDVRSLYPHIMRSSRLPCRLLHSQNDTSLSSLARMMRQYFVIADVHIKTDQPRYPYRLNSDRNIRVEDRLTFPIGDYYTTLCGHELRDALHRGNIVSVGASSCYEQDYLFTQWVDHWSNERDDAREMHNGVKEELCKLMMNSLYGRFSMGRMRWQLCQDIYPAVQWGTFLYDDVDNDRTIECRAVGGNVLTEQPVTEEKFNLVAVASAITSAGRYYLRTLRSLLPAKSVLYQDTDSLLVTDCGQDALVSLFGDTPPTLGSLRHVETYQSASLFAPRNISLDSEDRIAGLPKQRERLGNRRYLAEVWERPESLLSRPCPDTLRVTLRTLDFSHPPLIEPPGRDGWTVPLIVDSGQIKTA